MGVPRQFIIPCLWAILKTFVRHPASMSNARVEPEILDIGHTTDTNAESLSFRDSTHVLT